MHQQFNRTQTSPNPNSPLPGRVKQQFHQTMPERQCFKLTQMYSNKVQFLQQPPQAIPIVPLYTSSYVQKMFSDDRSKERISQSRHNKQQMSNVQPYTRRSSEEKENMINYYGLKYTSSRKEIPSLDSENIGYSPLNPNINVKTCQSLDNLDQIKEEWKKQVLEEFRVQNSKATIQMSKLQEQIQYLLDQQKKMTECETLQKILNKEVSLQTLAQSRTDIIEKVVSLEEIIENLKEEFTNQPSITEDQCRKILQEDNLERSRLENERHQAFLQQFQKQFIESFKQPQLHQLIIKQEKEFNKFRNQLQDQLKYLTEQFNEMKYSIQKTSMIKSSNHFMDQQISLTSSNQNQQNQINTLKNTVQSPVRDEFEYSYKKPPSNQQDQYDAYIKKYENFNKQVSDYLLNRKVPNHLNNVIEKRLFSNDKNIKNQNDVIEQITANELENDLSKENNFVNSNMTQFIKFSPNYDGQRVSHRSITDEHNSSKIRDSPSIKSESDGSPIKALNGINENSGSPFQQVLEQTQEEPKRLNFDYKCLMSKITEKEFEDEEYFYEQEGFTLNQSSLQSGDPININLQEDQIQCLKKSKFL